MLKNVMKKGFIPETLIITPLKTGDKISDLTLSSVEKNNSFIWYSYEKKQNIAKNFHDALMSLDKIPKFVIKIDNDTEWIQESLDFMKQDLLSAYTANRSVGYCYCGFEYIGAIKASFPAVPFDIKKLLQVNYISSNSLFISDVLKNIPLVKNDKYIRLLDWAYYLKLLYNNIIGHPCYKGYFFAKSTSDSISARGAKDYNQKYKKVFEDFVIPIIKKGV